MTGDDGAGDGDGDVAGVAVGGTVGVGEGGFVADGVGCGVGEAVSVGVDRRRRHGRRARLGARPGHRHRGGARRFCAVGDSLTT